MIALPTVIALPEPPSLKGNGFSRAESEADDGTALAAEGSSAEWSSYFQQLAASHRAYVARVSGPRTRVEDPGHTRVFWLAAERAPAFRAIYPDAQFDSEPVAVDHRSEPAPSVAEGIIDRAEGTIDRSDALLQTLTGWMQHIGPTTAAELSSLLALPESEVDQTLLRLESTGAILRGSFRPVEAPGFSPAKDLAVNSGALAPAPSTVDR